MAETALISEDYRKMQEELHRNPAYGTASIGYAPLIAQLLKEYPASEILDYGAGKGRLTLALLAFYVFQARCAPCVFWFAQDLIERLVQFGRVDRAGWLGSRSWFRSRR